MPDNNNVDVIGRLQMFDFADWGVLGVVVVGVDIFDDVGTFSDVCYFIEGVFSLCLFDFMGFCGAGWLLIFLLFLGILAFF